MSPDPVAAIGAYLREIYQESVRRAYRFNVDKISLAESNSSILCTRGQLLYEWEHLLEKLSQRDVNRYRAMNAIREPEPHPLFQIIEGEIEAWEIRR